MGCVVYYVLTAGSHPFGPPLRRQANIETDDYSLQDLSGVGECVFLLHVSSGIASQIYYVYMSMYNTDQCVASELLKNMISHNSNFR